MSVQRKSTEFMVSGIQYIYYMLGTDTKHLDSTLYHYKYIVKNEGWGGRKIPNPPIT